MEVLAPAFIEDLFRFALLHTGSREFALARVAEVVSEAEARAGQWRTQGHRFLWAVRLLSDRLEKGHRASEAPSEFPEIAELRSAIEAAKPNVRSALALECLGVVKPGEASQLFCVRPRDWRVATVWFWSRLASEGLNETQVQAQLKAFKLSPEEVLTMAQAVAQAPRRRRAGDRALGVAAVLLGVLVLLGWLAWERWRESPAVLMRDHMTRLLDLNRESGVAGLEAFEGKVGESADWLFLHGMEGVQMPPAFAQVQVAAARLVDFNGGKVAQFPTLSPPGLFMVADAETLGLGGERSDSGRVKFGEWSGVWAATGPHVVLWMVRSDDAVLDELLRAHNNSVGSSGR